MISHRNKSIIVETMNNYQYLDAEKYDILSIGSLFFYCITGKDLPENVLSTEHFTFISNMYGLKIADFIYHLTD
jgi:hypothetical protein